MSSFSPYCGLVVMLKCVYQKHEFHCTNISFFLLLEEGINDMTTVCCCEDIKQLRLFGRYCQTVDKCSFSSVNFNLNNLGK